MATETEIERTYLPSGGIDVKYLEGPFEVIEDTYFPPDLAEHAKLRVRRKGQSFTITKKIPVTTGDASIQEEHTIELHEREYSALIAGSKRSVTKRRYKVTIGSRTAEIDVFLNDLDGLVLVDLEFDSVEEFKAHQVPFDDWRDVTQEEFVAGGYLAGRTYADIEADLQRYSYVPSSVTQLVSEQ